VCSQGSVYWSHNDACAQVLGREHSGHVRGVGLGPTPGKSTSYTSRQGSISSVPTPKELEMAAEMKRLKTMYEAQNVKLQEQDNQLQEQNNKYAAQQEELAAVKRMTAMIMAGKQPSMGNNEEGDVLVYI
jgi:ABC-type transport system involved in cytochrome bd biosynthesis fused ATPase/permease subunit